MSASPPYRASASMQMAMDLDLDPVGPSDESLLSSINFWEVGPRLRARGRERQAGQASQSSHQRTPAHCGLAIILRTLCQYRSFLRTDSGVYLTTGLFSSPWETIETCTGQVSARCKRRWGLFNTGFESSTNPSTHAKIANRAHVRRMKRIAIVPLLGGRSRSLPASTGVRRYWTARGHVPGQPLRNVTNS